MRAVFLHLCLMLLCSSACIGSSSPQSPVRECDAGANADASTCPAICTTCGACEETLVITSALHVTGAVEYDDPPPAGGPHDMCWGMWGVQTTELRPERWVHNLEHGGIVFLYHCEESCDAEVKVLEALTEAHPRTVLTSYAALPTRFAVVSWGHRIKSDCLDRAAFEAFYVEHVGHGPESIATDPPAECAEFPDL
jgi:hypothetical protein